MKRKKKGGLSKDGQQWLSSRAGGPLRDQLSRCNLNALRPPPSTSGNAPGTRFQRLSTRLVPTVDAKPSIEPHAQRGTSLALPVAGY